MKTKKYHLMLATVITILFISALGNTDLPPPIKQRVIGDPPFEPGLIGQPHPALVGIDELYVVIQRPSADPNKDGLVWSQLEKSVSDKIKEETGIIIAEDDIDKMSADVAKVLKRRTGSASHLEFRSANIPELRVDIDMLKLRDSQQYVFHIQTSLAAKVYLPRGRPWSLKADVWKAQPTMRTTSIRNMPNKVTDVVLEQVEAFINAYKVANPPGVQPTDAYDANSVLLTVPGTHIKPVTKFPPAKYKYLASKNSKVFHRPQCSFAGRIAPKNLVGYNTRQDAIRAGKRPCKICKP